MAATSEYGVDNPPQPLNGVDRESFHTAKNFSGSESTSSYYTAAETPSSSSLELSPPLANEAEAETEPTIKDDINELRGRVEAIERQLQQAQKVVNKLNIASKILYEVPGYNISLLYPTLSLNLHG